uniref:Conotoxin Superfamily SF1 n=1 Tax=Conus episcopatus TaxID=88764 RepID=A0A0K2S722_CONEP|nr:Conotoxin Superfamily SF1 [Conus episcopatus]
MADNSSLTFLQFFLPVFFFLSPSHLLSLLLPAVKRCLFFCSYITGGDRKCLSWSM